MVVDFGEVTEGQSTRERQLLKLLMGVSRDAMDPLKAITELNALAMRGNIPETVKAYLRQADGAAQYILSLMNNVSDISKFEAGRLRLDVKSFDFGELLKEISALFSARCEQAGVHFACRTSPRVRDNYVGDERRIRQIMMNLLEHALSDSKRGCEIVLDVRQTRSGRNSVDLTIVVIDNGNGIEEESIPGILNALGAGSSETPVNTANLGLVTASDLVQLMGGTMTIDSRQGLGTRTTVEISLTIPEETRALGKPERDSSVLDIDFENRRILLVEDNQINAEVTQDLLEAHGFRVEHASNGEEAVGMFEVSLPSQYDAILMDIRMPVMDGLEAVRKIRCLPHADSETVPIIAMSANAFAEDIEKSLEAGMNAHLSKPVDSETLFSCLAEYLL